MSLANLPGHSRIWIFNADRWLNPNEENDLKSELDQFVSGWQAHGKDLIAGYEIFYHCIIVVAIDDHAEMPSGCSIDKVFRLLQEQAVKLKTDFFNRMNIYKIEGEKASIYTSGKVKDAVSSGEILHHDLIVNTLIDNLQNWKIKHLILASESWISAYFTEIIPQD